MLADLSAGEYADWEAFAAEELIGPERGDQQAATVAALLANVNRNAKRRPTPFSAIDFMPYRERPKPSTEQQMAMFDSFFHRIGGD